MAIAKIQLILLIGNNIAIMRHGLHPGHHVLHLAAICPCIHEDCAPQAARNAAGKLQPCQPVFRSKLGNMLQIRTCPGNDFIAVALLIAHRRMELDDSSPDTLVQHQHVGAIAQHGMGNIKIPQEDKYLRHLLHIGRKQQIVRRPPDIKGRMPAHRLIHIKLFLAQQLLGCSNKILI